MDVVDHLHKYNLQERSNFCSYRNRYKYSSNLQIYKHNIQTNHNILIGNFFLYLHSLSCIFLLTIKGSSNLMNTNLSYHHRNRHIMMNGWHINHQMCNSLKHTYENLNYIEDESVRIYSHVFNNQDIYKHKQN